MQLNKMH